MRFRKIPNGSKEDRGDKEHKFTSKGGKLYQLFHRCRGMATYIPDFPCKVQPLTDILELAYRTAGKWKRYALKRSKMYKVFWGTIHDVASIDLKGTLRYALKRAYPNGNYTGSILPDASDMFWAEVIPQSRNKKGKRVSQNRNRSHYAPLGDNVSKHK